MANSKVVVPEETNSNTGSSKGGETESPSQETFDIEQFHHPIFDTSNRKRFENEVTCEDYKEAACTWSIDTLIRLGVCLPLCPIVTCAMYGSVEDVCYYYRTTVLKVTYPRGSTGEALRERIREDFRRRAKLETIRVVSMLTRTEGVVCTTIRNYRDKPRERQLEQIARDINNGVDEYLTMVRRVMYRHAFGTHYWGSIFFSPACPPFFEDKLALLWKRLLFSWSAVYSGLSAKDLALESIRKSEVINPGTCCERATKVIKPSEKYTELYNMWWEDVFGAVKLSEVKEFCITGFTPSDKALEVAAAWDDKKMLFN